MPTIPDYQSTQRAASSTALRAPSPEDLGAGVGRALQQAGQSVAYAGQQYEKFQERRDVSKANKKTAELRNQFTEDLRRREQEAGGDEDIVSSYLEDFDNAAASGVEFNTTAGREAYDAQTNQLRFSLAQRAIQSQAARQGKAAVQDFGVELDHNRNAVRNDPTQFGEVLYDIKAQLSDPEGRFSEIPAAQREELARQVETDVALSAVQGVIDIDPEMALQQLSGDRWDEYLDADKKDVLIGQAEMALRAQDAELRRQAKAADDALKEAQRITQNTFLRKANDGRLSVDEILNSNLDPFGEGSQDTFIRMVDRLTTGDGKTDPATYSSLYKRVFLPPGAAGRITDYNEIVPYIGAGVSVVDGERLRGILTDGAKPENKELTTRKKAFFDQAESQITASTISSKDPVGDRKYYEFQVAFEQEFDRQVAAGKSPFKLLDPQSPDYLGYMIGGYTRTLQEQVKDAAAQFGSTGGATDGGALPPELRIKPGESIDDYLARRRRQ